MPWQLFRSVIDQDRFYYFLVIGAWYFYDTYFGQENKTVVAILMPRQIVECEQCQ